MPEALLCIAHTVELSRATKEVDINKQRIFTILVSIYYLSIAALQNADMPPIFTGKHSGFGAIVTRAKEYSAPPLYTLIRYLIELLG